MRGPSLCIMSCASYSCVLCQLMTKHCDDGKCRCGMQASIRYFHKTNSKPMQKTTILFTGQDAPLVQHLHAMVQLCTTSTAATAVTAQRHCLISLLTPDCLICNQLYCQEAVSVDLRAFVKTKPTGTVLTTSRLPLTTLKTDWKQTPLANYTAHSWQCLCFFMHAGGHKPSENEIGQCRSFNNARLGGGARGQRS